LLPKLPIHEAEKNKLPGAFVVNPKIETANVISEISNAHALAILSAFKTKEIKPPIKGININNRTIIGPLSPGGGT
jgi:hypothetical protein